MRRLSALVLVLVIHLASARLSTADDRFILSAEAAPSSILADGKSYSQIIITVTGTDGHPAPDGTQVRVSTTAGNVTTTAYAGGGRATAILTSTTSPEIAIVTCSAGGASASTQVEFSSFQGDSSLGPKVIRMEGGSLAYSVERDVILASDGVAVDYNGFMIHASSAQISEQQGVIKAQGEVCIKRGDESLSADALVYDLRTDKCRLLADGSVTTVSASSLFKSGNAPKTDAGSADFSPLSAESTKNWVIAKKLTMFPHEKIQFTRASIYMGNTHLVDLPHYFYDYNNRGALMDQIRYTQWEGFVADIPMYYRVTDDSSGALKLRYAQKGSDYGGYDHPRKGPSIGLEQAYSLGPRSDGRIFLDSISDKGRSLELRQHHEFGSIWQNGRADLSLRYQPNGSFAKGVYTAYLNASLSGKKYDYYLSGFVGGSQVPVWDPSNVESMDYASQADSSVRATIRPRHTFSLAGLNFSPNMSLGYGRIGTGATSMTFKDCMYQSAGLSFHSATFGSRTMNLSFDGSSDLTNTSDGRMGASLRLGTNLRRSWRGGSASLGYTMNLQGGPAVNMFSSSVHTLTGTVFAGLGAKWSCCSYFGYGLDTGRLNLSGSAMYEINRTWKLRGEYSLYRYKLSSSTINYTSSMSYLKAGIYRPVGPYEIGLAWSPTGQQAWSSSSKKLWLEIGLPGF